MKYREYYLDGLRGWAAVIVVIFHMSWEIFGNYFPIYRHYLLRFFLDGKLAVYLFFIISGQSLATSYLRTSNNYYFARMVTVRYLRLSLPIFFSCFLVYILMKFGFTYGNEAGSIVSRSDWLGIFIKFEPEFWRVIKYSFSDVFFKHSTETSYNPFLWTMSIELAGSFFLFATLPILKYLKNRIAFALSAALYLFLSDSIYAMFFIGLLFALLRVNSHFIQKIRFKNFLGLLILLIVVTYDNNLWRMHGNYDDYTNRVMSIMAISLLFAILLSQKIQKIFTMSLSKFLGKISFALYLVQFPVIMSYTSYLILFFNEKYSYISFAQANFIIFSSVGLSVIFAIPFASLEVLLINKINDLVGRYLLTYEGA